MNRRIQIRQTMFAAVGINTAERKNRAGVTRNISNTGVLFHSSSKFALGEQIELTVCPPASPHNTRLKGTVVRVAFNLPNPSFPHLTAVQFDRPLSP